MAVVALLALMLSVCVLAAAEEPTDPAGSLEEHEHTRFLPEQECLPHDAATHALVRICADCGAEVPEFVPHNCPPSDRPYKDDGNSETHSRLVRCADCGFWVPQQQAHTWVHYSYTKYDGTGDYHIEVLHCSVCGAVKQVTRKHEWNPVSCMADGNVMTHICSYECTVCGDHKEVAELHTLEHYVYKNDGSTAGHIEVLECTGCGQLVNGERRSHLPEKLYWKKVSDTQDQLTVWCSLCGLTYQEAPENHKYDGRGYESDGTPTGYHTVYQACIKCGARDPNGWAVKEKHSFSQEVCTECGQPQRHEGNHDPARYPSGWTSINENQHAAVSVCILRDNDGHTCGAEFIYYGNVSNHTFDPITMKCTVCGYLKEGCEHKYTFKPAKNGIQEDRHTVVGVCSGCGKQIEVTGAHDMQFASATEYKPYGDGHTRDVTERCSVCGYEVQHTETGNHDFSSDESAHECSVCGEMGEHDYFLVGCRNNGGWIYHTCVYKCQVCMHEKEERQGHPVETLYEPFDGGWHIATIHCPLCGIETRGYSKHVFDESGTCACGYQRGDQVDGVLGPQAGQTEDPGDGTTVTPVFCRLTADGKEMPFGYELIPLDEAVSGNGKAFNFIILPESIPGEPVIGVRFTASELALLQAFGVKSVYICPGVNDILLLDDVSQALTALTGQEIDELVITLTPESSGAYTVQYDPAGVYITE